jgi:hypothetical protein
MVKIYKIRPTLHTVFVEIFFQSNVRQPHFSMVKFLRNNSILLKFVSSQMDLMGYSGAGGKLTHEKNQKQKIL